MGSGISLQGDVMFGNICSVNESVTMSSSTSIRSILNLSSGLSVYGRAE